MKALYCWSLLVGLGLPGAPPVTGQPPATSLVPVRPGPSAPKVPLGTRLKQLEAQYRVQIAYRAELVEGRVVNWAETDRTQPVDAVLEALLTPLDLRVKRLDATSLVIVPRREERRASPVETPPLVPVAPSPTGPEARVTAPVLTETPPLALHQVRVPTADEILIGRVTDERGEALAGVNVTLKGTSRGATTDATGRFRLAVPSRSGTLVFSFIGYQSQEVLIGSRSSFEIRLDASTQSLNEVVVVGYGTQERKTLTSAITSVKPADIQNLPVSSVEQALQGRAAGVQIIQNSGAPGSGSTVRIRGLSSIRASNDPLYVVDGIPINGGLDDININDIESIDVLKDAAAAAVYGARAANGVILIQTRRGSGRPRVTLNASRGIQNIARQYEMLTGPEQLQVMREMYDNRGIARDAWFTQIDTTVNVPWSQRLLRDNAPVTTIDLSLRGGEGRVKYATSLNYFDQEGILINSGYRRLSGRLNLDIEVSKRIRFGNSLVLSNTVPRTLNTAANGVYLNSLIKNPLTPDFNPDGSYNFVELYPGGTGNPLPAVFDVRRDANGNRVIGSVFGEVDLLPGLTFRTTWGIDYTHNRNETFTPSTANLQRRNSGSFSNSEASRWVNTNALSYTRKLGDQHTLSLLAVHEQQADRTRSSSGNASNFPNDKVPTLNAAARLDALTSSQSSYGLESIVGRVTYSFRDKYVLSANLRRDGSSRFGLNNRYGVFPSASLAWNIGDEPFIKKLSFVRFLKLRGSAGSVGNQNGLGNFTNRGLYTTGNDYLGEPGVLPGALPNPELKWETTAQYNVGVDVGLFDERIILNADAYLKDTRDLLLDKQLMQSSGVGTVTINLGRIQNRGLEFGLTTRNLVGALKWNTNFNLSMNRNKVTRLYGNDNDLIQVFAPQRVFGVDGLESVITVGRPLGSVYGYIADGIYARSEDNVNQVRLNSATGHLFAGGDLIYRDLDGNNFITAMDRLPIGNMQPDFVGGMNNTWSFRGFTLDVFLNWSVGNDVYNATRQALTIMEQPGLNSSVEVRNRWRQPGDVAPIPRAGLNTGGGPNSLESTFFVEDGSYLRVSNIQLAYQFPAALLQPLRVNSLRVFATAFNPYIFTRYKGIDPDVRSFTAEGQYGVDFGAYPRARTFTLGLTLGL